MVNFLFLLFYVFFQNIVSASDFYYVFTVHCILNMIVHLRNREKITPIFLFYISVIIVNYANLVIISNVGTRNANLYTIEAYIGEATQIWCISSTLIMIGYKLAINKSLPSINFELNRQQTTIMFYVLLFSNLATLFQINIYFLGGPLAKAFALLNSVGIIYFSRLWAKESDNTYRTYTLALFVVETYVALTTAFLRFYLILPTVCVAVGYFIGKGKFKYLFSYRLVPFLIIVGLYSSVFKTLQNNRSNFITVFENMGKEDEQDIRIEKDDENRGALLERSSNLGQLTNVVKLVAKNGQYNGKASEPLLVAIIPRAIWPDKPTIALGQWFALEMTGAQKDSGSPVNSVNMSVPGELYLDFGWLGVAIGSLLFGAFYPLVWNAAKFYYSEYNLTGTIFGGFLLLTGSGGFGADLQIVITLLSIYLTLFLIKKATSFK